MFHKPLTRPFLKKIKGLLTWYNIFLYWSQKKRVQLKEHVFLYFFY